QPVVLVLQDADAAWNMFISDVLGKIPVIKGSFEDFMKWFQPFWTAQLEDIVNLTVEGVNKMAATVQSGTTTMQSVWNSAMVSMFAATKSYFDSIVAEIGAAVDAIIARLNAARAQISSHSIWPDMLNEMLQQTKTGMGSIQDVFQQGIQGSG